jgi:predicted branched-subunit amino acid permease
VTDRFSIQIFDRYGDDVVATDDASFGQSLLWATFDLGGDSTDRPGDRRAVDRGQDRDGCITRQDTDRATSCAGYGDHPNSPPNSATLNRRIGSVGTVSEPVPIPEPLIDRRALADVAPLAIPVVPFGFVVGLAITESAMPQWAGLLSSPLIFAGASQLAMITLAGSASIWAIIAAVFVINTRHLMYSAALAPAFRHQPRWMRWGAPFLMVDQTFALSSLQTLRSPAEFRRYYLTTAGVLFVVWNAVVPLGMLIGPVIPGGWRLDFAPPIMFAGLTLFAVKRVSAGAAAIVGGLTSLAAVNLNDRLGIVIGAIAGVVAGAITEQVLAGRRSSHLTPHVTRPDQAS